MTTFQSEAKIFTIVEDVQVPQRTAILQQWRFLKYGGDDDADDCKHRCDDDGDDDGDGDVALKHIRNFATDSRHKCCLRKGKSGRSGGKSPPEKNIAQARLNIRCKHLPAAALASRSDLGNLLKFFGARQLYFSDESLNRNKI